MSGQVLSVLVSAKLSGLVYKVLSKHGVCRTENHFLIKVYLSARSALLSSLGVTVLVRPSLPFFSHGL